MMWPGKYKMVHFVNMNEYTLVSYYNYAMHVAAPEEIICKLIV